MITRGVVRRVLAAAALVSLTFAGPLAASARADAPRAAGGPTVCAVGKGGDLVTAFTSVHDGSTVDLAKQPRFTLAGTVTGGLAPFAKVSLFADGKYLGDPSLNRALDKLSWSRETSAPAGTHVVTACAYGVDGKVSGAQVKLSVLAPGAGATVVSPDVVPLKGADLASVTGATSSTVTFDGEDATAPKPVQSLAAGDVLVGGVSSTTPQGLLRKVTSVTADDGSTVVSTKPASLTDVLWQADVDMKDVPVDAKATTESKAAAAADSVVGDGTATAAWHYDKPFSGGGPFGATAKGNVSLDLTLKLRVRLEIESKFVWGQDPQVTVKDFLITGTGTGTTKVDATTSQQGDVTFERKNLVNQVLAVIPLAVEPPVVLTPTLSLDLNVTGTTRTDLKWSATGTVELVVGTEYRDGAWTPIRSGTVTGAVLTPIDPGNPGGVKNLNTLTVTLTPRVDLKFGGVVGPSLSFPLGAKVGVTYPCPGSATVDAFLQAQVGVNFGFLAANLGSASATVLDVTKPVYRGVAPGCLAPKS